MLLTIMTADAALYRLLTWLSPGFPVGAFSYSHALEAAVEAGKVHDRATLVAWLDALLGRGAARSDAILLAETWRAVDRGDRAAFTEIAELAAALRPSRELALETTAQGEAFIKVIRAAWGHLAPSIQAIVQPRDAPLSLGRGVQQSGRRDMSDMGEGAPHPGQRGCADSEWHPSPQGEGRNVRWHRPITIDAWLGEAIVTYPVAVGLVAAASGVACRDTVIAYLQAFVANIVSATVRLVPLGQTDGQAAIATLETAVLRCADRVLDASLDDIGGATPIVDILSMRHETQYTRLFRS
jgi:urease accessory protein